MLDQGGACRLGPVASCRRDISPPSARGLHLLRNVARRAHASTVICRYRSTEGLLPWSSAALGSQGAKLDQWDVPNPGQRPHGIVYSVTTDTHPSEGEIATAIGWVAIEAARLEYATAWVYANLIGPVVGEQLALGQNWATIKQGIEVLTKTRARRSLHNIQMQELYGNIRSVLKAADALQGARAEVIHGHRIAAVAEAGALAVARPKRWGATVFKLWKMDDLVDLRAKLAAAADKMTGIFIEMNRLAKEPPGRAQLSAIRDL
jgi:hypothetical protein